MNRLLYMRQCQTGGNDGALRDGVPVRTVANETKWRTNGECSPRRIHEARPQFGQCGYGVQMTPCTHPHREGASRKAQEAGPRE